MSYTSLSLPRAFQLTTSRRGRRIGEFSYWNPITFQLTTSRRGRPVTCISPINVRGFQLTTSRRGRLRVAEVGTYAGNISTHDLTKRSTLHQSSSFFKNKYFNSRPHEEVDAPQLAQKINPVNFNSRPHEEVDSAAADKLGVEIWYFNSRPHEEVDFFDTFVR